MGGFRVNILEFSIGGRIYAIKADYVKAVFDVEEVERVPGMPDYVIGLVRHGEYVYPLLCPERFLEVGEGVCQNPMGKIAIGVSYKGRLYAFLADKIVRIREVEKAFKETIVDYHTEEGQVIMEISPEYLERKAEILAFCEEKAEAEEHKEEVAADEEIFLLARVGSMMVAFPCQKVRKVEEIEREKLVRLPGGDWMNRVYSFNGRIVKLGDLKRFLGIDGEEGSVAVIVGDPERSVGFLVDDIVDMVPVKEEDMSIGKKEDIFCSFFVYGDELVSVVSGEFLDEMVDRYSLKSKRKEDVSDRVSSDEKQILIVRIGNKRFAVDMENVLGIVDYSEAKVSLCLSDNPYAKGIVVTRNYYHVIYALDEVVGEKVDPDEAKILIFKDGKNEGAFLINEVEDLIVVPKDKVKRAADSGHSLGGVVEKDGELINLVNLKSIVPREFKVK